MGSWRSASPKPEASRDRRSTRTRDHDHSHHQRQRAATRQDAQAQLTKLGVAFNRPDPAPFRALLKSAGFYTEWKAKYGDEVWAKLEKYSGHLG